ncbi:MAG: DUF1616 domain-containing protein [Deinococcota bacterium]
MITALGLAVVFAILVLSFPEWQSLLRVGLGAVVMLLIPGYLMTIALFPQRDALHIAERVALTLGLSAITIIITGVVLNFLPVGIRPTSIAVGIASASAGYAALGGLRRSQLAVKARFHLPSMVGTRWLLVVLVGFIGIIYLFDLAIPEDRFTEFYLLSASGELDNYPRILTPGETFELRVGITNLEGRPQTYLLRTPLSVDETIRVPRLDDGERWELPVTLQAPAELGAEELVFELLREDDVAVYRQVEFTIDVRGERVQEVVTPTPEQTGQMTAELLEQSAANTLAWLQRGAEQVSPFYLPDLFLVPPERPVLQVTPPSPNADDALEPVTQARGIQAQGIQARGVQDVQEDDVKDNQVDPR